jgi:glutamate racemase
MDAYSDAALIGVFDSGVGGLSVLRALRERLPQVSLLYVADSAYAPYGPRTAEDITARSERVVRHLVNRGASMIVVACNTATTAAIGHLRAAWPDLPFVGVEPGIKPAVARSRSKRVAVMATTATVNSLRVRKLVELHGQGAHVHLQACPGLVDAIEAGKTEGPALAAVLQPFCESILAADVDTVVLGCTHYPFIADKIRALLGPGVELIDTASAIAERAATQWKSGIEGRAPALRLQSTGDPSVMTMLARRWLSFDGSAEKISLD